MNEDQDQENQNFNESPQDGQGNLNVMESFEKKSDWGKKGWIIATILIIVMLLIAGGAYGAWKMFLKPSPEELVKEAFENFSESDSYAVKGGLKGSVSKENVNFTVDFAGNGSMKEKKVSKLKGQIDTLVTLPEGQSLSLGLDARFLDDTLYFRMTKMPPILAMFGVTNKQWFRIENLTTATGTDETGQIQTMTLTPEERKEVRDIFTRNDVFIITEPFEETEIDGLPVRHLAVAVNKENLKIALVDLQKFMTQKMKEQSSEGNRDQYIQDYEKGLEEVFKSIENVSGEIWIDTEDHFLRKEQAFVKIQNDEFGTFEMTFDVNFSDYGKEFEVVKPAESVSLEEFLSAPHYDPLYDPIPPAY